MPVSKSHLVTSFQTGHLVGHLGIVIVLAHWSLHYDIDIVVVAMTANLVIALNGDAGPLAVGVRWPSMPSNALHDSSERKSPCLSRRVISALGSILRLFLVARVVVSLRLLIYGLVLSIDTGE